jgi:uncharacterized protein (DUF488 family)
LIGIRFPGVPELLDGSFTAKSGKMIELELMTVGYEGMVTKEFLDLLDRCKVQRIIDVRELPISRRRGFAKAALSESLQKRGIEYTHMPALGCPRNIRHEYRDDEDWQRYTLRFHAYLKTKDEEMRTLRDIARRERCCLLCFERDFNFCHRLFVAERLIEFVDHYRIHHLTGPIQGRSVERRASMVA